MIFSAIVGCGAISRLHCDALKKAQDVKIVAVCDKNRNKAEALVSEMDLDCKIYTDYEEMLCNEKLDFVHICTPHFLHLPQTVSALNKGINVLCEKPVCMNPEEFKTLEKAVEKSSAKLCVSFQNRTLSCNEECKKIIMSGEYGKVRGIRGIVTWDRHGDYYTSSGWRGKKATEGGSVLMNQAIHTLDLMIYFLGKVKDAEGVCSNYHMKADNDTEDTANIYMKFANGAVGIFYATTAYSTSMPISIDIDLEKAKLSIVGSKLFLNGKEISEKSDKGTIGKEVWGVGHSILIDRFYHEKDIPIPLSSVKETMQTIWKVYSQNP